MVNPDLFVWTSDWHFGRGRSLADMQGVVAKIIGMQPVGVIDLGDCKDAHDGADHQDQLAAYKATVLDTLPWAATNPEGAPRPVLPGNHDELNADATPPSDFSPFTTAIHGAPWHWTVDWTAPRIRIIAVHARIVKSGEGPSLPYPSFFTVDPAERQWLRDQLAQLPTGWTAIVCSHPPLAQAFGNHIGHYPEPLAYGGPELHQIIRDSGRVVAYLNGHRHANMNTVTIDNVLHINGPGVSYTLGNGFGGFVPITYDPMLRTLTFDFLLGRAPFARFAGYTPLVVQLPPLPVEPPPGDVYTFQADSVLEGDGPLAGKTLHLQGTLAP